MVRRKTVINLRAGGLEAPSATHLTARFSNTFLSSRSNRLSDENKCFAISRCRSRFATAGGGRMAAPSPGLELVANTPVHRSLPSIAAMRRSVRSPSSHLEYQRIKKFTTVSQERNQKSGIESNKSTCKVFRGWDGGMEAYRTETVAFSLESFLPGPLPGFFLVADDEEVPAAADADGGSEAEALEAAGEPPAVDGFLVGPAASIKSSSLKVTVGDQSVEGEATHSSSSGVIPVAVIVVNVVVRGVR